MILATQQSLLILSETTLVTVQGNAQTFLNQFPLKFSQQ
jgi:hypothetical protein